MTTIATECNQCPESIISCAHMDGRVVWLVDQPLGKPHATGRPSVYHWAVEGPDAPSKCGCGADHVVIWEPEGYLTDSLPDAEAEYERRCALLRAEA